MNSWTIGSEDEDGQEDKAVMPQCLLSVVTVVVILSAHFEELFCITANFGELFSNKREFLSANS